ncbi:hypothetical protein [Dactylosporangium darangshiense]
MAKRPASRSRRTSVRGSIAARSARSAKSLPDNVCAPAPTSPATGTMV